MSETSPARWHGNSGPGLGEITGVPATPREGPLFWVGQLLFSPGQSRAPLCGHCNGWQGTLSQRWVGRTHSPLGAGCGLESPERSERQAVGGSGPLHPGGSVAPFWIGITGNKRGKCCTGAGPALSLPPRGVVVALEKHPGPFAICPSNPCIAWEVNPRSFHCQHRCEICPCQHQTNPFSFAVSPGSSTPGRSIATELLWDLCTRNKPITNRLCPVFWCPRGVSPWILGPGLFHRQHCCLSPWS